MFLWQILRSPSIRASLLYAASGACFILATLTLARVFPPATFGVTALIITISNVGVAAAPAGMVGVLLRHDIRTDSELLRKAVLIHLGLAAILGSIAILAYRLSATEVAVIVATVMAGSLALLGLVPFQRARRFNISVPLSLVASPTLLLAAALIWIVPALRITWLPTLIVFFAFSGVAAWAWTRNVGSDSHGEVFGRKFARDWFSLASFSFASELMWQLERLLIPALLDIGQLAVFAVVAALAVAPYHMISAGASVTLIPRLRAEPAGQARRAILAKEFVLLSSVSIAGGIAIVLFAPIVIHWYVGPKFQMPTGLIAVAVASGIVRVIATLARTPAAAFCTPPELARVSLAAWLALAFAAIAAWALSGFGLIGLILGVMVGWLVRGIVTLWIASPHLR